MPVYMNCGQTSYLNMNSIKTLLRIASATPLLVLGAANADLVITGVFDGPLSGGTPKGVELYATSDIADLSIYGITSANNGDPSPGSPEFALSGSAVEGEYIYIASESSQFQSFFGFVPDFTDPAVSINGDDAIELYKNGAVHDVFGVVGTDGSGEAWEYADGWAYRSDNTGPDGTSFVIGNWSFSGVDALDGETTNGGASTPFPVGSYSSVPPAPVPVITNQLGTNLRQAIALGNGAGEVVASAKVGSDFYIAVTDNPNNGVSVFQWDGVSQYVATSFGSIDIYAAVEAAIGTIDLASDSVSVTSVALDPRGTGLGVAAVQVDDSTVTGAGGAIPGGNVPQQGYVCFFNVATGNTVGVIEAGFGPDMVTVGDNGYVAVANEAESPYDSGDNYAAAFNQSGSVSLYNFSALVGAQTDGGLGTAVTGASENEVGFTDTDTGITGVRYPRGTTDIQEIEPEYVSILGNRAFISCQENNAIAVLDDVTTATTGNADFYSLGSVTYIADVSDRDDAIDISVRVKGLHMPDAIKAYDDGGTIRIVTADEGDALPEDEDLSRLEDFGSAVVGDLSAIADTPIYDDGNGALSEAALDALINDENELGRLEVLVDQSTDGSGDLTDIVIPGSRGVSVFTYTPGTSLTRESHLSLESYIASRDAATHNANDGGDPGEFDARSDAKGNEPEAIEIVDIGGTLHAVVGNERQNSVVAVDLSDETAPVAVSYNQDRPSALYRPETATVIPAGSSPTGSPLAAFGFEGDAPDLPGGIGIYQFEKTPFALTVLHNNDGESDLFEYDGNPDYGHIGRFKTAVDAHDSFYGGLGHAVVKIYAGDSFLAGPEFQASLASGAPGARTFYDALALSRIGYDAFAIGNHELDFGPDVLAEFIGDAQTTNPSLYLSANLDFSSEADMQAQVDAGNVASSAVFHVATPEGVKKIGVIGATTENLPFITSPEDTVINAVAAAVNAEKDTLLGLDVDAIILVSHLQGIDEDEVLVPSLESGIDLIVAGGGDEILANLAAPSPKATYGASAPGSVVDTNVYPGADGNIGTPVGDDLDDDEVFDTSYPVTSTATDLGGNTIPIVTGAGSYGYLGRVTLNIDAAGAVALDASSNPALIVSDSVDATNGYGIDVDVAADIAPVDTFVQGLATTVIGRALNELPQSSNLIRSDERAVGNLVADAYLAKAQAEAANFGVSAPQVALVNGGGIRAAIPAGDISALTTFNVSPFGNFVAVVEDVTTADLKLLLENAYSKTVDDDASAAIDPIRQGSGTGRFAQLAGLSVTYDISKNPMILDADTESVTQAGERVLNATLDDGTPLIVEGVPVPATTVDLTLPFFNAVGGDQYFFYVSGGSATYLSQVYTPVPLSGNTDQQALQDFITGLGTSGGNEIDLPSNFSGAYDSIKDGRIVTVSDLDTDGIQDEIEELLGSDFQVASTADQTLGSNPAALQNAIQGVIGAALAAAETTGESNVVNDPAAFNLYTDTSILDLRMNGVMGAVDTGAGTATVNIDVFSTGDLSAGFPSGWTKESTTPVVVPAPAGKAFYRLNADQP